MKTFKKFLPAFVVIAAFIALGAGSPYLPVWPSGQLTNPKLNTTNTVTANVSVVSNGPSPAATFGYPLVVVLHTNQSFVVQDRFGNNILGARADAYNTIATGEWEILMGSKAFPLTDWQVNMGTSGADAGINIGGNAQSGYRWNTLSGHMTYDWLNTNATYAAVLANNGHVSDDGGGLYCTELQGETGATQTVVPGAAAGAGAAADFNTDGNASDISVQLELTTGTGTAAGVLLTYSLENLRTNLGYLLVGNKATIAPVNDAAAQAAALISVQGDNTTIKISAAAGLDQSTLYQWNIHNIR